MIRAVCVCLHTQAQTMPSGHLACQITVQYTWHVRSRYSTNADPGLPGNTPTRITKSGKEFGSKFSLAHPPEVVVATTTRPVQVDLKIPRSITAATSKGPVPYPFKAQAQVLRVTSVLFQRWWHTQQREQ